MAEAKKATNLVRP